MTKIKIKHLLEIAEKLKNIDPMLSRQLKIIATGALRQTHQSRLKVSASFTRAIQKVSESLDVDFALVGGLAVHYYIQSRTTQDIDFAVMTSDTAKLRSLFPGRSGALVYTAIIEGVDVDFLLAEDFPWTKEAIDTSHKDSKLFGLNLRIVKPEFLILYKIEVARDQDNTDIKNLLRLQDIPDKTRPLVKKYLPNSIDNLEQLIKESEIGV
jgi:predicted nucleotidyltransferase